MQHVSGQISTAWGQDGRWLHNSSSDSYIARVKLPGEHHHRPHNGRVEKSHCAKGEFDLRVVKRRQLVKLHDVMTFAWPCSMVIGRKLVVCCVVQGQVHRNEQKMLSTINLGLFQILANRGILW